MSQNSLLSSLCFGTAKIPQSDDEYEEIYRKFVDSVLTGEENIDNLSLAQRSQQIRELGPVRFILRDLDWKFIVGDVKYHEYREKRTEMLQKVEEEEEKEDRGEEKVEDDIEVVEIGDSEGRDDDDDDSEEEEGGDFEMVEYPKTNGYLFFHACVHEFLGGSDDRKSAVFWRTDAIENLKQEREKEATPHVNDEVKETVVEKEGNLDLVSEGSEAEVVPESESRTEPPTVERESYFERNKEKIKRTLCTSSIISVVFVVVFVIIGLIVALSLIFSSFQTVEYDKHGILYNKITTALGNERQVYGPCPVPVTGYTPDLKELITRTKDGVQVSIELSFQYKVNQSKIFDLFSQFPFKYEEFLVEITREKVQDIVSKYSALDYFSRRSYIGDNIKTNLTHTFGMFGVDLLFFQLRAVKISSNFEYAILENELSRETKQKKEIEREFFVKKAEMMYIESEIIRNKTEILKKGESEAHQIRSKSEEEYEIIVRNAEVEYYDTLKSVLGFNETQMFAFRYVQQLYHNGGTINSIVNMRTPFVVRTP